jgi:hypothetical protein
MKNLSIIVAVLSLLLIIITSPPPSHPDSAGPIDRPAAYWTNPDGSRGPVTGSSQPPASPRRQYSWINPDGAVGSDDGHHSRSLTKDYAWVNPDGTAGTIRSVHARTARTDSTF